MDLNYYFLKHGKKSLGDYDAFKEVKKIEQSV
jgi:hypothetical protein